MITSPSNSRALVGYPSDGHAMVLIARSSALLHLKNLELDLIQKSVSAKVFKGILRQQINSASNLTLWVGMGGVEVIWPKIPKKSQNTLKPLLL